MLNGIGGRTIAEAQATVSYREFLTWISYRRKRGTLHTGMRLDNGFALLASMYANTHSKGGFHLRDFAPYHDDDPVLTLEQAMETWH